MSSTCASEHSCSLRPSRLQGMPPWSVKDSAAAWKTEKVLHARLGSLAKTMQPGGMAEDRTLPRPSWGTDQYNPSPDQHGQRAAAFAALVLTSA